MITEIELTALFRIELTLRDRIILPRKGIGPVEPDVKILANLIDRLYGPDVKPERKTVEEIKASLTPHVRYLGPSDTPL